MIAFFKACKPNDFKCSRQFWDLYSAHIKLRSDGKNIASINSIRHGSITADHPKAISELFNSFFTSISSSSSVDLSQCEVFIDDHFNDIKQRGLLKPACFSFTSTTSEIVRCTLAGLDSTSGPGLAGIS